MAFLGPSRKRKIQEDSEEVVSKQSRTEEVRSLTVPYSCRMFYSLLVKLWRDRIRS